MGFYRDQLLPRALDLSMRRGLFAQQRAQVTAGLDGEVLEIGFGTGLNIPFYPAGVKRVLAVEPAGGGRRVAERRLAARADRAVPVEFVGLDASTLPAPDASMDHVLSTWTLCTIPDVGQALRELLRVLRPGGQLHFLDHGLAPDERVRRWQRRLDPLQQRVAGGCHFTRPIAELIRAAGFTITSLDEFYEPGPKVGGADSLGVAVPPV
jgi:ubiquinone/menaquinone biosynthesis C-methylase UbiE